MHKGPQITKADRMERDKLIAQRINQGMSVATVSRRLGLAPTMIYMAMKRLGIKPKHKEKGK